MNKPLDLPDVTLDVVHSYGKVQGLEPGANIRVTHKKTGMATLVPASRLNAWLLRQLRQELVSNKEKL